MAAREKSAVGVAFAVAGPSRARRALCDRRGLRRASLWPSRDGAVPRSSVQCRMPTLICLLGTGRQTRGREQVGIVQDVGGWTRRSRTGALTGLTAQVDGVAAPCKGG